MPLQNRVTPDGTIIATAARGLMLGNRGGCFHRDERTLKSRHWASRQWICCVLSFKGRRRAVMAPGLYTELFFLDEATALAAGHRPCFECRRADARQFQRLWADVRGLPRLPKAPEMDEVLHAERLDRDRRETTRTLSAANPPDGAFFEGSTNKGPKMPILRWVGRDFGWRPEGYAASRQVVADARVAVLTPPTIVDILRAGYRPLVHPSAGPTG